MWHETGHRSEVTCIERSPKGSTFAVGYADGSVRLWDIVSKSVIATFNGHKRAITALAFDDTGARLASGSQDTDLILWDVIAEAGLFRCVMGTSCRVHGNLIYTQAEGPSGSNHKYSLPLKIYLLDAIYILQRHSVASYKLLKRHFREALGLVYPALRANDRCSPG
jgi:WD40 repeat protein